MTESTIAENESYPTDDALIKEIIEMIGTNQELLDKFLVFVDLCHLPR
jgi:hypothetical protein